MDESESLTADPNERPAPGEQSADYDADFYSWAMQQARALRAAAVSRVNFPERIDFENVAEEIESLGKSQQRELYSRYRVLLLHLLKWHYQPESCSKSWGSTIRTQRAELAKLLKQNPGLKPMRATELAEAYPDAREAAADETDLPLTTFPETCPFTPDEVEDRNFWPAAIPDAGP